jgi:HEPN domain-containing protein
MSRTKAMHQARRWLQTAEEDLRAAEALYAAKFYAQACFYAQQSAEKAVKSLWYALDTLPWGHSIQQLVTEFPFSEQLPNIEAWIDKGALLDKFYIPTRYPNGLPDLTPGEVYRRQDAERGLAATRWLISACRRWLLEREG